MKEVKQFAMGATFMVVLLFVLGLVAAATTVYHGGNVISGVGTPLAATDAANKAYVDSAGGSTFEGFTASNYTGNMSGITGANANCAAEFSGSHICTVEELILSGPTSFDNQGRVIAEEHFLSSEQSCDGFRVGDSLNNTYPDINTVDVWTGTDSTGQAVLYNDGYVIVNGNSGLELLFCLDMDCTEKHNVEIEPSTISDMAIAIGDNGFPFVAYNQAGDFDLVAVACENIYCSTFTYTILENRASGITDFEDVSVVIRDDGLPYVTAYDSSSDSFVGYDCGNALCTSGTLRSWSTVNTDVGLYNDVVIRQDGRPIAVFEDATGNDWYVHDCDTASNCNSGTDRLISSTSSNDYAKIIVREDGRPLVLYSRNNDPYLYTCDDENCTSGSEIQVKATSMDAMDLDLFEGLPLVSYVDESGDYDELIYYTCNDANCTSGEENVVAVYSTHIPNWIETIILDGNPITITSDAALGPISNAGTEPSITTPKFKSPMIKQDGSISMVGCLRNMSIACCS